MLGKLAHYGFRGPINDWFRSYLTNRKQKVLINGFESDSKILPHGVPQGSVLGPILFLLYINDLNNCIKFSTTYHFADDTNLLSVCDNYKILCKNLNLDLKYLVCWLTANKISLNEGKTELIFFHSPKTLIPNDLNIKLNGKRLLPSNEVKYLGVYLDEHLNGEPHCSQLVSKLNRANGMLAKARHFVPLHDLKNLYHAIFSSHLMYGCQIWTQKLASVSDKNFKLQKNAMRIMTFSEFRSHTEPLFKRLNILKFSDSTSLQNCVFVHDFLKGNLPSAFKDTTFVRAGDVYSTETRQVKTGMLFTPRYKGTEYGLKSIYKSCINSWNNFTSQINILTNAKLPNKLTTPDIDLKTYSRSNLKRIISNLVISTYE